MSNKFICSNTPCTHRHTNRQHRSCSLISPSAQETKTCCSITAPTRSMRATAEQEQQDSRGPEAKPGSNQGTPRLEDDPPTPTDAVQLRIRRLRNRRLFLLETQGFRKTADDGGTAGEGEQRSLFHRVLFFSGFWTLKKVLQKVNFDFPESLLSILKCLNGNKKSPPCLFGGSVE